MWISLFWVFACDLFDTGLRSLATYAEQHSRLQAAAWTLYAACFLGSIAFVGPDRPGTIALLCIGTILLVLVVPALIGLRVYLSEPAE